MASDAVKTLLEQAYEDGVYLEGAQLARAQLDGVTLWREGKKGMHLEGCHLQDAKLDKARLRLCNLEGADLTGAWLSEAELQGADLTHCQMTGTVLQMARLQALPGHRGAGWVRPLGLQEQGAILLGAQLEGAILSFADLRGAFLVDAQMVGTQLAAARLEGAELTKANLQEACLVDAQLQGAQLRHARLLGADLRRAQLGWADLSEARMDGAALAEIEMNRWSRCASVDWGTPREEREEHWDDAASVFRALKEHYRETGNYRRADECYVREARCWHRSHRWWKRALLVPHQAAWGYGAVPWLLLVPMVLTILLFGLVVFPCTGMNIPTGNEPRLMPGIALSLVTFGTLGYGNRFPASEVGEMLAGVEAIIATLLSAMFVVALARKYIRG